MIDFSGTFPDIWKHSKLNKYVTYNTKNTLNLNIFEKLWLPEIKRKT